MHLFSRIERSERIFFIIPYMYPSHEKRATKIIKKSGHNVISKKKKYLTKTFNFDDKLKINICATENNKEKHMLSHIFILRTRVGVDYK
jgi:hypothetical protein